jgi:HAD superfamily hydrolase (TIGR01509 family)
LPADLQGNDKTEMKNERKADRSHMQLKAAIFDMDGVLFDTERIYQQTWQELADERGIQLEEGFVRAISGTSGTRTNQVIEQYYHVEDGTALRAACRQRIKEKLEVYVPIKEGVPELLAEFKKRGMKIAIASSSRRIQIESNLRNSNLTGYFDEIVSGEDVEHGKPAPDIFLAAAEALGCRPEECYVFEDSENGVRAGHSAGCYVVMVPDVVQPGPDTIRCCSEIQKSLLDVYKEVKEK